MSKIKDPRKKKNTNTANPVSDSSKSEIIKASPEPVAVTKKEHLSESKSASLNTAQIENRINGLLQSGKAIEALAVINNYLKQDNCVGKFKSSLLLKRAQTYSALSDYEAAKVAYIELIEYNEAINLDKRTLLQLYYATLKREHLIIFTFIVCDDYNLFYIKLSRFLFLMASDMAFNAFFFSDDSMHKLYLNYGKYDFIQDIPQLVYSTIFSQLMEVFICFLSLTDKYFYEIKESVLKGKSNKTLKIFHIIDVKLSFFYLFTFIFFIFYYYIIYLFCAVYKNTQFIFIKDSIISFCIGLIYSLILYFFSSCLRMCSIRWNKKCIFQLSELIPFF